MQIVAMLLGLWKQFVAVAIFLIIVALLIRTGALDAAAQGVAGLFGLFLDFGRFVLEAGRAVIKEL